MSDINANQEGTPPINDFFNNGVYQPPFQVWDYNAQEFIFCIPVPEEKRMRVDRNSFRGLAIFPVEYRDPKNPRVFHVTSEKPLTGWRFDMS
tara:strand:- start:1181 stop:1456 length:276 start_codon:yes stop_codon:yes gene_type:complete